MTPEQKVYALVMGRVIGTLRGRAGLTQTQLADRVSVGQATISRIERGAAIPDAMLAARIAPVVGVTVAELHLLVEDGLQRTQDAAVGAMGGQAKASSQPWWAVPVAVAGFAGLAGLAIFAVAAALGDDDEG